VINLQDLDAASSVHEKLAALIVRVVSGEACESKEGNIPQDDFLGVLEHPRSQWMQAALPGKAQFEVLAKAADYSHVDLHSYSEDARTAKV
jgi:hypothetical protein